MERTETKRAAPKQALTQTLRQAASLPGDQVFAALCEFLMLADGNDLLANASLLAAVIPELRPLIGFDQRSPHHAYDLYTHVAYVVAGVPAQLPLRWAALLHDIGKIPTFTLDETGRGHFYGHASRGAEMADAVLCRLGAPAALRERVVVLIEKHMTRLSPDGEQLRRQANRLGWETLEQLLYLQEADMGSKGTGKPEELAQFVRLRACLEEIRAEKD